MKCTYCADTGSYSKSLYEHLDCTKCDTAIERSKLSHWAALQNIHGVHPITLWLIYQHGKQAAETKEEK